MRGRIKNSQPGSGKGNDRKTKTVFSILLEKSTYPSATS